MPAPTPKSAPEIVRDLWELLRAYAKQETVDPLKALKGKVTYGIGGGALVAVGGFFLALGVLRGLQHFSFFQGAWSFWPFFIVALLLGGWAGGLVSIIKKSAVPADRTGEPR